MKSIIGTNVGSLLHDLNNDLSLIVGYADLANKCAAKDGDTTTRTRLASLRKAVDRMVINVREAQYSHKLEDQSI